MYDLLSASVLSPSSWPLLVASPDYIKVHGTPETPEELVAHEALLQGTESWRLMNGDEIITVRPQGRFKAGNGTALAAAAAARLGMACSVVSATSGPPTRQGFLTCSAISRASAIGTCSRGGWRATSARMCRTNSAICGSKGDGGGKEWIMAAPSHAKDCCPGPYSEGCPY